MKIIAIKGTKERNKVSIFLSLILLFAVLSGCGNVGNSDNRDLKVGEPDRLGIFSMGTHGSGMIGGGAVMGGGMTSLNQAIKRSENWQKIVADSPFQLGEKTVVDEWIVNGNLTNVYMHSYGTYPSIDGSAVALPMAAEFARQILGFSDKSADEFVKFSSTDQAYENLITKTPNNFTYDMRLRGDFALPWRFTYLDETHPVDLIIVAGQSAKGLEFAAQHGITLVQKAVCFDAFVFITHSENPVDSLTVEQVRGIYSGAINNWNEVSGNDAPIVAYQREEGSVSQTGMIDLVMKDLQLVPPEVVGVSFGSRRIEAVAEYKNDIASIGYTYKYYIDNLYKNEDIKILMIDGIPADEENIRTGAYPFSTCYYGIIRSEDENATGGKFLDWILSDEGQACIEQAGYIPNNS